MVDLGTPAFMYFAYHCYLAQPIQDERLLGFLENLNILYSDRNSIPSMNANTNTCRYQNERPLLAVFMDEGKQESGAKSIFYILRMLSLLVSFCRFRLFYLCLSCVSCIDFVIVDRVGLGEGKTCMKFIVRRLHNSIRVSRLRALVRGVKLM